MEEDEDDRLSARAYGAMEEDSTNDDSDDHLRPQESLSLKFRNYTPQTHLLDGYYTTERAVPGSITHLIQDKLDILKQETDEAGEQEKAAARNEIDPRTLDLKKIDWDLKRRIEKRVERLDRETRKQIDRYTKQKQAKSKPR